MEANQECQVCFVTSSQLQHPCNSLIRCVRCSATAHKYCYQPSSNGDFICDGCKYNYNGNCVICDNPGLLKRVVQQSFAHPVCLLFSHAHMENGAYLVNSFKDLSFLLPETGKQPKRTKCSECGKMNSAVHRCNLQCPRLCHIYCAMKSRVPAQGKGWLVSLPYATMNAYSDQFQHIVNRKLLNHNDFLKKKLSLSKQSRRQQILIYCQQHSVTMVECTCRSFSQFSEEKDEWIYCQGCCRWLHQRCVENKEEAKDAIKNNSYYICAQCTEWKKALKQQKIILPQTLPKLHLYDFIFIHTKMEEQKYQVSEQLLDFALKIPVLPGKQYIEIRYRKEIGKMLKNNIQLQDLRKQFQSCDSEVNLIKYTKILNRNKQKLFLVWWLCQGQILGERIKKEVPFLAKKQDEILDTETIKQAIEMMIKCSTMFNFDKRERWILLKNRLDEGKNDQPTKSLEEKEDKVSIKFEKLMDRLRDQIRMVLFRLKENKNKQNISLLLGQIHAAINSTDLVLYQEDLPNILIVQAFVTFKKKQVALRYLAAFADLDILKSTWKDMSNDPLVSDTVKENLRNDANRFLKIYVYEEKDETMRSLILKEWGKLELSSIVPSPSYMLAKRDPGLTDITFQNISIQRITEELSKFQSYPRTKVCQQRQQLTIILSFLETLQNLSFTKEMTLRFEELLKQNWSGKILKIISKIAQQFISLYQLTQQLLNEESIQGETDICVFETWAKNESVDNTCVARYAMYFQDISGIRIDIFSKAVTDTLKEKIIKILQIMEQQNPIFDNDFQFRLFTNWCTKLHISPVRAGAMMERDKAFQHRLNLLFPCFDNLQTVASLQSFLSEHLKYFLDFGLEFRVQQIKVLMIWIDLQSYVLSKLPPSLLLPPDQVGCIDNPVSRPDFFVLKEALTLMKQLRFPDCMFLQKFEKIMAEGEILNNLVGKIFDLGDWGFELTQEYGDKITLQQFNAICDSMKQSPFFFEAEMIELDAIKKEFYQAEQQAQLLSIQYEKDPQHAYLQDKAKSLLIVFGTLPISSKCPQFLWSIYEQPKRQGLPENLEKYITDLAQSQRLHSWQELHSLQIEIDTKLECRSLKKDYVKRLKAMISPNQDFAEQCEYLVRKWIEGIIFSQNEIEMIEKILEEEKKFQFEDEDLAHLRADYGIYLILKSQAKWHHPYRFYDSNKLALLNNKLALLHSSFVTPEIEKYKTKLEDQLHRATHQVVKIQNQPVKGLGKQDENQEKESEKRKEKNEETNRNVVKFSDRASVESDGSNKNEKRNEMRPIYEKKSYPKTARRKEINYY